MTFPRIQNLQTVDRHFGYLLLPTENDHRNTTEKVRSDVRSHLDRTSVGYVGPLSHLAILNKLFNVFVFFFNETKYYYAFPTGSVYGFGIKRRRRRRTPASSETASNIKILHIVNKAGLFHILFGLIKFLFLSVLWF